jgi:diguanylate cyclase (GGDEF)-like protein
MRPLASLLKPGAAEWPHIGRWSLRPKMALAFVTVAATSALCGFVGLFFVNSLGTTVSGFMDVASPLLLESAALVENTQRTRSTFYAAIDKGDQAAGLSQQFLSLERESRQHIEALRTLSARAGADLDLDAVGREERAFHVMVEATIRTSERAHAAAAVVQAQHREFATIYTALQERLHSLINRAEGSMFKAEDEAKVEVQTRTATVDGLGDRLSDVLNGTYPVVQNATALLRLLEQIEEMLRRSALASPNEFAALEQKLRRAFHEAALVSRKLAGRLRGADDRQAMAAVQGALADLDRIILRGDGLLANYREEAAAKRAIADGLRSFEEVERAYLAVINNVQETVRHLNQRARQNMEAGVVDARTITAAAILLTILAAALFSVLFAHRLTAPLAALASAMQDVSATGELRPVPQASVTTRADEIGTLSRSFNAMIGELAAAREALIANSEAEIKKQYERLDLAINSMPQGLCMFDAEQKLIVCNRRYAEIYGLKPEHTAAGTSISTILRAIEGALVRPEYVEERMQAMIGGKPWQSVHDLVDNRTIAVSQLPLPGGGTVTTHEDITERRKVEAKIAYMAHHDMLTKLPNRVSFRDEMQKALEGRRDAQLAVLCLDLDYFKNVNDTLGHPIGDALLRSVADRLRQCLRPSDKVARLGGDEFAIVQTDLAQPGGATGLAGRLIREIGEPFTVEGHQVVIGTSIGISLAPADGNDPDLLLKNADMALYRAKEDGRGTYRYFEPNMDARMQARRNLELDLRKALPLGEFELFYQPLVNIETGRVSTCEALLRWHHPRRGLMPPSEFIPLAEEIGFINQLGSWVLAQGCVDARRWPEDIRLSVNLSPVQFKSGVLVADVAAALKSSGLAANRLELEITESVLLIETEATLATLKQLRELGVHISMDDFGTGYSSLGYLRQFPFDKIKIDQSFIRDLADKPDSIAIIRAVTGLANTLGIATTAEGVETDAQLQQIRREGCTEAQGFLFSRPVTARALLPVLESIVEGYRPVVHDVA